MSGDVWSPAIAADGVGGLHLVYTDGPDWDTRTLTYQRFDGSAWTRRQKLTSSIEDRSYYLNMAAEPNGTVHIAFWRFNFEEALDDYQGDVYYIKGREGIFWPEERITATPELEEMYAGIGLGPGGEIFLSFLGNGLEGGADDPPIGRAFLASKR
jgi:hypothetical protein